MRFRKTRRHECEKCHHKFYTKVWNKMTCDECAGRRPESTESPEFAESVVRRIDVGEYLTKKI